jgi:hypothetical protein
MNRIADQTIIDLVVIVAVFFSLSVTALGARFSNAEVKKMDHSQGSFVINLPAPVRKGKMSLEEALKKRESVRSFSFQAFIKKRAVPTALGSSGNDA